jgi:hypothetical protein
LKSNDFKKGIINGYQIVPLGDLTALSDLSKQIYDILIIFINNIIIEIFINTYIN